MHLDINIDLGKHALRRLAVEVKVKAATGEHVFSLAALAEADAVAQPLWRVSGGESRVEGELLRVNGSEFVIGYEAEIIPKVCLGSSRNTDLLYPFINESEIFFGTGLLPVPREQCTAALRLSGLPAGGSEYSSLLPGGMSAAKLAGFFCYCAQGAAPAEHVRRGKLRAVTFRLLAQRGAALPMAAQDIFGFFDGYMGWLEESLAPYQRAGEINFLVLQAPPDFAALAGGRTFATGENVLNGIACYAPADAAYVKANYGCGSYAQFLYEGLAHELMHFYTAAVPEGREKSVLYPAPGCPAYATRLLGEALNLYFCNRYVSRQVPGAEDAFGRWLARAEAGYKKSGKRQPLLDLRELDGCLRASGSSLLALFREMVLVKLADRSPYDSAGFMFEVMRSRLKIAPPPQLESGILAES